MQNEESNRLRYLSLFKNKWLSFEWSFVWCLTLLPLFLMIAACDAQYIRLDTSAEMTPRSSPQPIITMERFRACKSCPAYQVLVFGDGAVTYIGKDFVNVTGVQNSRLNLNQIKSLVVAAESLHFESLSETYVGRWLDAGLIFISYNGLSTKKSVRFQPVVGGGPPALDQFADLIDTTIGTFRWVCPVPQANELVCAARKKAFDSTHGELR